jgi:hypothetical protein
MKKILLLFPFLFLFYYSKADFRNDSIVIVPQPIKNYIYVHKKGFDSMKFNLFLFTTSGRMVSSITNSEVLYIRDIQSGNYILEIFGINNEFKYRYIVNVEN